MRQGEIKICSICYTPKYKRRRVIDANKNGNFYCSMGCFQVGKSNLRLSNQIEVEWI